ncbi:MAG TPA: hypothetical protein VIX37_14205 [Candidatus Sulfotelmatobacter sp.]
MAGVADDASGVVGGDDLGEGFGFCAVRFVAAGQMTAVSSLDGFTDAGSSACLACAPWQASQASCPACAMGAGCYFGDGRAAIVSVLV